MFANRQVMPIAYRGKVRRMRRVLLFGDMIAC